MGTQTFLVTHGHLDHSGCAAVRRAAADDENGPPSIYLPAEIVDDVWKV